MPALLGVADEADLEAERSTSATRAHVSWRVRGSLRQPGRRAFLSLGPNGSLT
jgi:hypothetical protein